MDELEQIEAEIDELLTEVAVMKSEFEQMQRFLETDRVTVRESMTVGTNANRADVKFRGSLRAPSLSVEQMAHLVDEVSEAVAVLLKSSADFKKRATGPQGLPGTNGKNGADGKDGKSGTNGKNGKNGKDGKKGQPGFPGRLVYQYDDGRTQEGPCPSLA